MALLIPLILATLAARFAPRSRRGVQPSPRRPWQDALAIGMAATLGVGASSHFLEPQRFGLVAIVPSWVPAPEVAVTATGLAELALAVGLAAPRSRRLCAIGAIVLLLALFPANVVAAAGVDHPSAPSTPLGPRSAVQAALIAACAPAAFGGRACRSRSPGRGA